MKSSNTFIRVSWSISEVKKSALINDYENVVAYSEQSKQSEKQANKCGLFQILFTNIRASGGHCHSRKIWLFFLSFKLRKSIPALKLTQNYYINMNICFFLKTGSLILNWVPLSFYFDHTIRERLFFTIYPFQLFSELGTIWKYNLGLLFKKTIFHFFPGLRKTKKYSQSNTQKIQNLVVNWKKLPKSNTQKCQF